jgi:hypothetical protein
MIVSIPSTESDEPRSLDDMVEWMQTRHDAHRAVSVHQGHMPEVEILDETSARGIWAMYDWVDRPRGRAFQGFGQYYEEYRKEADGQWRIRLMRISRSRRDETDSNLEHAPNYGWVPPFWPS